MDLRRLADLVGEIIDDPLLCANSYDAATAILDDVVEEALLIASLRAEQEEHDCLLDPGGCASSHPP